MDTPHSRKQRAEALLPGESDRVGLPAIDEKGFASECYPIRRQKADVRRQKVSPTGESDRVRLSAIGEKVFAAGPLILSLMIQFIVRLG